MSEPQEKWGAPPVRLVVDVVRLLRLRAGEGEDAPPRVIGHIQAHQGDKIVSAFGQVEIRSQSDEAHVSGAPWQATERLLDKIAGQEFEPGSDAHRTFERILDRLSNEISQEIDERAQTTGQERRRSAAERTAQRLLRLGKDIVKRRPLDPHPEKRMGSLVGTTALRLALQGVVEQVTTGEQFGECRDGTWFTGDLETFYAENLESVARYAVAPAPAPPSIDGEPANVFPDAEAIEPLPKDGTKGHLLEREALAYGLSSVRFPN